MRQAGYLPAIPEEPAGKIFTRSPLEKEKAVEKLDMRFFHEYLEDKFGRRVYRVTIDPGLGCPRGSALESRCFFCDENGARAAHIHPGMPLQEQISAGIGFIRRNHGEACGLAAYVQAHTGTNSSPEKLEELYGSILASAGFDCLIIATRPDALPDGTVSLLGRLSREIELWVELGVQSANDETLRLINRGHDFRCVQEAARHLDAVGVNLAAHVILGLPGEGRREFHRTAARISALPFKAVKIHNLLILRDTVFEGWHRDGRIRTMNEHQYAAVLLDFVRRLPPEILLMRVCADADEDKVLAPKWGMDKAQFIEMFRAMISEDGTSRFSVVKTADASPTLWHPRYREHYRSIAGARSESRTKFVEGCEIRRLLAEKDKARILEIGLGHGCNLSETLKVFRSMDAGCRLDYLSVENDISGLDNAVALGMVDEADIGIFKELLDRRSYSEGGLSINILEGEGREVLPEIAGKFDAVYLDPFSTESNVEMWTYDFIAKIASLMEEDAILATYSSAYTARGALARCGFHIGETSPLGRRRGGTLASFSKDHVPNPISAKEWGIIRGTTAGLAYRDPGLSSSRPEIKSRRTRLAARLRRRGIPKWLKG